MRALFILALGGLAAIAAWQLGPWREIRHGAGVMVAPADPVQENVPEYAMPTVAGYDLTELARYFFTARVLSTKRYRHEAAHELVPIDVAIGWGRMSDEAVLDRLEISQGFRFYFYGWKGTPPLPVEEIARHSANVHIIPVDAGVERTVYGLRRGSVVRMRGSLVRAQQPGGPPWPSSLTRDDVGAGACELLYLQEIKVL